MEENKALSAKEEIKIIERLPDSALKDKLPELRKSRNVEIVTPLLRRWNRTKDEELASSLFSFFLDAKGQDALEYFIDAIRNEDFEDRKNELISILWQSSMDASDYFNDLIEIALNGDYMTIIEVSTVIDSFERAFYEDEIVDGLYTINEAVEQEEDEERQKLLINLSQIISELYTD